MAASYCLLFLWMASLVALSYSEHTIQVQVFPSNYSFSNLAPSNYFIYYDEACQTESGSLTVKCSGTPKLMDCDLGPDNGLPSDTTESFYSLKLNSFIFQYQILFFFTFNHSVNLTALSLHYYCTAVTQEDPLSFCVDVLIDFILPLCLPCVDNHKQRATLSYEELKPRKQLFMTISSNYSSQLYISEIQFFIEAPIIDDSSDDQELRIPCLVSTSDVPSTCDHWWVDYGSYDDIQESITLGVHDRPPECGSNNTSSVCVDEEYTDDGDGANSCQIVVTFEDDCSELMPTIQNSLHSLSPAPSTHSPSTLLSPSLPVQDGGTPRPALSTSTVAGIAVGAVGGIIVLIILLITISIFKYKVRVTSPNETSVEMKSNECYATTNAISSEAMEIRNEAYQSATNTVVMEQNEAYNGTVVGTNDDVTYEEVDSPYEEPC